MNTIGVLLDNTQISQLSWTILSQLNKLNQSSNRNCTAFYMNPAPLCVNNFCSVNVIHDIHKIREGVLIATNMDTAEILLKSQTTCRKVFFVWDLEFVHNKNSNYLHNYNIMNKLELWTRSESYADAIENYCGVRPRITKDSLTEIINAY
jgi:hypothetical protein